MPVRAAVMREMDVGGEAAGPLMAGRVDCG